MHAPANDHRRQVKGGVNWRKTHLACVCGDRPAGPVFSALRTPRLVKESQE